MEHSIPNLIPHRPPMLLINTLASVAIDEATTYVTIDEQASFFEKNNGVPSWIGLEYMGQTAALIGGHQVATGESEPQLGFLMGTRRYTTQVAYFNEGLTLRVHCQQHAIVGESLAMFNCQITDHEQDIVLAIAKLSVFRQPIDAKPEADS